MGLPGRALRAKAYAPRNRLLIKAVAPGDPTTGPVQQRTLDPMLAWDDRKGQGWLGKPEGAASAQCKDLVASSPIPVPKAQKIPFGNALGSNLHTTGRLRFDGTMRTATLGPNGLPKAQRF